MTAQTKQQAHELSKAIYSGIAHDKQSVIFCDNGIKKLEFHKPKAKFKGDTYSFLNWYLFINGKFELVSCYGSPHYSDIAIELRFACKF